MYVFISEKKTKIVVALRNPKDMVVSFYHHHKGISIHDYNGKFPDYLQLFVEGKCKNKPYTNLKALKKSNKTD